MVVVMAIVLYFSVHWAVTTPLSQHLIYPGIKSKKFDTMFLSGYSNSDAKKLKIVRQVFLKTI